MAERLTFERASEIARRAVQAYERVETKAEVEEIFLKYGKNGIGHRALCRILFSNISIDKALKGYTNTQNATPQHEIEQDA